MNEKHLLKQFKTCIPIIYSRKNGGHNYLKLIN